MFSFIPDIFQSLIGTDFSQFHKVRGYYCGAAGDSRLTVNVNVGFGDVLFNELVWAVEETLYVLSGVVWYQDTEVLDVGVDEEALLPEYWHNSADMVLLEFFLILSQFYITQEQSSKLLVFVLLGFDDPIEVIGE